MKILLWLLRVSAFVLIAPVIAIVMAFIFIDSIDWWFSRKEDAVAVGISSGAGWEGNRWQ